MFKQSSSRNQRAKGFKVKHALQVLVLVAACIWLLYQVKHSHDKTRALEASDTKISTVVKDNHSDVLRFGRRDLPQDTTETNKETELHDDDEGNEKAEGEEENKPEESDEEEGQDVGDDQIDENDQEGEGANEEHSEEPGDDEEKEGQSDEKVFSNNQEQDEKESNVQEAREEHYRGDDASSAVVRDTDITESEARINIEDKIKNAQKDPDAYITTKGAENGHKIGEFVLPVTSEIHISDNTSMNGTSLLDRMNETESQANLILSDNENRRTKLGNSTLEPPIMLTEMQNNSIKVADVGNDGSPLLNSTTSMTSAQVQNLTTIITETEEISKSADDGRSKSKKILIEHAENSNSTNRVNKVEENSPIFFNMKEGDNAIQADSNDPLAKVDTEREEQGDSSTSSSSKEGDYEFQADSNDQLA